MEVVGIRFENQGAEAYLAQLTANAAAETKLAAAATGAVSGINALDDSQGRAAKAAQSFAQMSQMAAAGAAKFADQADGAAADAAALGDASDKAAKDVDDLGDKSKKSSKDVDDLGDKSDKAKGGLDGLGEAAKGAAREIGANLVDAAAEAGQAIVQFIGDSIGKAGDFEQQMNRFASVTGEALDDSGQSLEDFKDLFISLGRELPVSTAEVQQAAIEMAKGGIEPATIAAGGLREVLNLAAAGEVGIAEAAEIASKQLGVWVDAAADASTKAAFLTETANLLSQAANASTVNVDDLALGLANVGGIAKVAGLSFRETVTTMALLAPGFSSAADAGTSLKTMLTRLQPTTETAANAMRDLGLLTAEGTSRFYDAQGSFIGMDKAAELLQGSLEGLSQAQKTSALQAIFGQDAFRAAALLAEQGGEGYRRMAAEMGKAGSAAVQAARKQQGFNVALDNFMGSVEALQITVMSAALPALTALMNTLAGGINAVTDYAAATEQGETALAAIANVVTTLAMPALVGLTSAATTYALVQAAQMTPAVLASIPAILAQASAWIANAAAVVAAAAPYAAIAIAIGATAWAIQDFNAKTTDLTNKLLESREWWNASTDAIERQKLAVGTAKETLAPYATEIANIRTQLQSEIKSLGERDAAGLVSDQQRATEQQHINELAGALKGATDRYNEQEQSLNKVAAAGMTATAQAADMVLGEQGLSAQTSLTTKDIEELGKQIKQTFADGQSALTAYAQSYSAFAVGVEQRSTEFSEKMAELEKQKQEATTAEQKAGIDEQIAALKQAYADQESAAAEAYAAQQTAQKQHLGQMLIDYTVAQAQLGNIAKDKAAEITEALETEYGLQESSTATTFLNMAQSIDAYANDSGASIDSLIGDLRENQNAAKETQAAMDAYAKEYTATQVNNFMDGKSDAESYINSLENIPTNIVTTVTIRERREAQEEHRRGEQDISGRAIGGTVDPMQTYMVGERGMELFTPTTAGYITPADALQRAMASGAQMGGASAGGSWSSSTIINVDARGSSLSMADITMAVQAGLAAEGRSADIRTRMGVQ